MSLQQVLVGTKLGDALQVLLRWVLQSGVAAVCEAAGKEIDRANVGVFEWELKDSDFKKLSNIKP